MNASPSRVLSIGISSQALFDLGEDREVLQKHGREAYRRYQIERAEDALPAGPGLSLFRSLLKDGRGERGLEVVIFSDQVADASLRILSSARQHDLDVGRAAFTGGDPLTPYLRAFRVDLFLSTDEEEAATAVDSGTAAALVRPGTDPEEGIRVAVEGRAVAGALDAGPPEPDPERGESNVEPLRTLVPRWVRALTALQKLGGGDRGLLRTALVSREEGPARARILHALSEWEVELDQAFFADEATRDDVVAAFAPHLVFDLLGRGKATETRAREPASDDEPGGSSFSRLRLRS